MVNVAMIGDGAISGIYLKNITETFKEVQLIGVCDLIPERAKAAVERYGSGIAVTDYHEVLSDPEVQAISVSTPNNVHAQISNDAMRPGKEVQCEKPAART